MNLAVLAITAIVELLLGVRLVRERFNTPATPRAKWNGR
jgi:hypothetical protein